MDEREWLNSNHPPAMLAFLQGIVQWYAACGEVVRASRVVPIGPWCVYWWKRFPAGYRLELEIGEP